MNKLAVVAFGGNALLRGHQKGTIDEQEKNVYDSCQSLVSLIKQGKNLVIAHGNGPQVGNVLLQHEAGNKIFGIPKMPMDVCVAETQGSIGYLIEQQMRNVLFEHGLKRNIITLVTQVIVDKNDKAFENPTKPVGPYYTQAEAYNMELERGWKFKEDPKGLGWRRVVASPVPVEINNWEIVDKLAREGNIVITVGGGGIPVYVREDGTYMGIDAVIDKDLASATLATKIKADEFIILTDVSNVYINFRKPDEKKLEKITVADAERYLDEGHFADGSMAPKVKAAVMYARNADGQGIITEASMLGQENQGTTISNK